MRNLNYDLKKLGDKDRDGSYATRSNRARMLSLMANQLYELGYRKLRAADLKGRHIDALLERWRREEIATGTIKNRMAALRWWADKIGKQGMMAKDNMAYGIPDRCYVSDRSKAKELDQSGLERIRDPYVRMSLELQRAFGLRREEAIKFSPTYADKGDHIRLKSSWTKGGKERLIPIRTESHRAVLNRAHQIAGRGSLIPSDRNYIQHVKVYERHCAAAGLSKMHGLRHAYAQERYRELTGLQAPAAGGPNSRSLTAEQRTIDQEARLIISRELGHNREAIVSVYVGR